MKISIAIVDDSSQNRILLADQINLSDEISVCFTAKNGIDFLEQMKNTPAKMQPDIVLMDIEMPQMKGTEAVKYAKQLYPDVKFLMLTAFDDDDKIFEAIKNGASGYLLKDEKTSIIIDHIQQLKEIGGAPMSPIIARKALSLLSRSNLAESSPVKKEDDL
ncbi:MAG: response regulator transcription factor, partial [Ferruginibacter sp.]